MQSGTNMEGGQTGVFSEHVAHQEKAVWVLRKEKQEEYFAEQQPISCLREVQGSVENELPLERRGSH